MKKTRALFVVMSILMATMFTSCDENSPSHDDPTQFSKSSIVGLWACVGSDHKTLNFMTGEYEYNWDYDPNAETYDVQWYFNIQSDSKVQYIYVPDDGKMGEYRRSDGYLHIAEDSEWKTSIDANYIFDQEHQAIRCPSGKIMGITLESVADLLGNDTIFFVKRYELDEAAIFDNTGFIQSQYVIRAKGIKKDL